jgi:putative cell wall-binding protein
MAVRFPRALARALVASAAVVAATVAVAAPASAEAWVDRYAGTDRYDTAAKTALAMRAYGGLAPDTVFVASGRDYPDALSAGATALSTYGPEHVDRFGGTLLLTQPGALPQPTRDALVELSPRRIVVVGGTGAVSNTVLRDLRPYAGVVERVAGSNRYATAVALSADARAANPDVRSDYVFIASGENYPDGLVAGSVAGVFDAQLLLARKDGLDTATLAEIRALDARTAVVAGGTGVLSPKVEGQLEAAGLRVERVAGADRYATAVELTKFAEQEIGDPFEEMEFEFGAYTVASGTGFADALSASNLWQPVLLTQPGGVPAPVIGFLQSRDLEMLFIVGGEGAVSKSVETTLRGL